MIPEALGITMGLAAGCEYWRTRRGPLVLLALAVLHLRAALLTTRWIVGQAPGMWRDAYPQAVEHTRRMDAMAPAVTDDAPEVDAPEAPNV